WDRATASRVTHFVAISETVRARIDRSYGRDSRVIPPPVNTEFYTPDATPREDFYLCASALVPYKRIDQAVAACARSGRRLVVIGEGPQRARLGRPAPSYVRFLRWEPGGGPPGPFRRCPGRPFPGEEDFGIVPIEARACGAPVIALGRGGAAENVDHAVGRTYPQPTVEALLATIDAWEADGDPHDPSRGRLRAEALATDRFRAR